MSNPIPSSVDDAITSRQSCRRYLNRPVSREQIHHLLEVARFAPSGTNVQPWSVYVTGGKTRDAIATEIVEELKTAPERDEREYDYYPTEWFEPYLSRRRACGWGLYGSLGITRENKQAMSDQRSRNYAFFDAPVGLFFTIDRRLEKGSWLDLGMFIQNVMIAARGQGLHSCAQAAFANYHSILRRHLAVSAEEIIVCGMSVGYGDMEAPENKWRTEREPVESFTQWFDL